MNRVNPTQVVAIIAASLVLAAPARAQLSCLNEFFPTKAVVAPLFVIDIDPMLEAPQDVSIELPCAGRYSLNMRWKLVHGPGNGSDEILEIAGRVELLGGRGQVLLTEKFSHEIQGSIVGIELAMIAVPRDLRSSTKAIRIRFEGPDRRYPESYGATRLFMRRELKYPILD